jgi:serine/threonine protein kinase
VKICDFGSSKSNTINTSSTCGRSWHWTPPETIKSSGFFHSKGDIWSLGITAIEMAHGSVPFSNCELHEILLKISEDKPPKLQNFKGRTWSNEFHSFVDRCLKKNPDERPSASELLEDPFIRNYVSQNDGCILFPLISKIQYDSDPQTAKVYLASFRKLGIYNHEVVYFVLDENYPSERYFKVELSRDGARIVIESPKEYKGKVLNELINSRVHKTKIPFFEKRKLEEAVNVLREEFRIYGLNGTCIEFAQELLIRMNCPVPTSNASLFQRKFNAKSEMFKTYRY